MSSGRADRHHCNDSTFLFLIRDRVGGWGGGGVSGRADRHHFSDSTFLFLITGGGGGGGVVWPC